MKFCCYRSIQQIAGECRTLNPSASFGFNHTPKLFLHQKSFRWRGIQKWVYVKWLEFMRMRLNGTARKCVNHIHRYSIRNWFQMKTGTWSRDFLCILTDDWISSEWSHMRSLLCCCIPQFFVDCWLHCLKLCLLSLNTIYHQIWRCWNPVRLCMSLSISISVIKQ